MNLQQPNANDALQTKNRSRDVAPQSGICSRCIDGCKGNCDLFHATFRGRELLYPEPFGSITAGADKDYPVDYSHLNIMGYALGAKGMDPDPDKAKALSYTKGRKCTHDRDCWKPDYETYKMGKW